MSRRKKGVVPALKLHKASGQGYVYAGGQRYYLGVYGQRETDEAYQAWLMEWLADGGTELALVLDEAPTVRELVARYLEYAERYYVDPDGATTTSFNNIIQSVRTLLEMDIAVAQERIAELEA